MKISIFPINVLRIAAVTAFVIGMASCAQQTAGNKSDVYSKYLSASLASNMEALRGGEGSEQGGEEDQIIAQKRAEGLAAYSNKDYAKAVGILEEVNKAKPADLQVPYYIGTCYLALDKPNQAETHFKALLGKTNAYYFEHAQWYMALIYVYKGELDKSKAILEEVVKNPNHYFLTQAENLLGDVEGMMAQ